MSSVMKRAVLMLNASYEAIRIITVKKAMTLITKGVAVVEVPTSKEIYPGIYLPSVIRLRHFAKVPHKRPQASRKNIFTRDGFMCLYCGAKSPKAVLELEHIIPRSRGGLNMWENLVCSCHACNQKKRDMTPEEAGMTLIHKPLPSSIHTARFMLKTLGSEVNEWSQFLWVNSDSDKRFVSSS